MVAAGGLGGLRRNLRADHVACFAGSPRGSSNCHDRLPGLSRLCSPDSGVGLRITAATAVASGPLPVNGSRAGSRRRGSGHGERSPGSARRRRCAGRARRAACCRWSRQPAACSRRLALPQRRLVAVGGRGRARQAARATSQTGPGHATAGLSWRTRGALYRRHRFDRCDASPPSAVDHLGQEAERPGRGDGGWPFRPRAAAHGRGSGGALRLGLAGGLNHRRPPGFAGRRPPLVPGSRIDQLK